MQNFLFANKALLTLHLLALLGCLGCTDNSGRKGSGDSVIGIRVEAKKQLPDAVGKRIIVTGKIPENYPKNHVWVKSNDFAIDLGESEKSAALRGKTVTVSGILFFEPPDNNPTDPHWLEIGESPHLMPYYYFKEWSLEAD